VTKKLENAKTITAKKVERLRKKKSQELNSLKE